MIQTKFLSDVTLVTDDMKQIQAHKVVLSAASPLFKSILESFLVNSIKYLYLKEILDFVYVGQASLDQNRVNEFLKVATDLEIQGLKQIPQVEGEHIKEDLAEKQVPMQLEDDII